MSCQEILTLQAIFPASPKASRLKNGGAKVSKGNTVKFKPGDHVMVISFGAGISIDVFAVKIGGTGDEKYLELLNEVWEMRKELLKRIIKDYEGEVWCISKHLLVASIRLVP